MYQRFTSIHTITILALCCFIASCVTTSPRYRKGAHTRPSKAQKNNHTGRYHSAGTASYYGPGFHGKKTANGETFNMHQLTAAHRTLPFGTKVKVINVSNNKSVIVRINDRGPFIRGRIIDLSYEAAKRLGFLKKGHTRVKLIIIP